MRSRVTLFSVMIGCSLVSSCGSGSCCPADGTSPERSVLEVYQRRMIDAQGFEVVEVFEHAFEEDLVWDRECRIAPFTLRSLLEPVDELGFDEFLRSVKLGERFAYRDWQGRPIDENWQISGSQKRESF